MARWVRQMWKAVAGTARIPAVSVSEAGTGGPSRHGHAGSAKDVADAASPATTAGYGTPKDVNGGYALLDFRVISDIRALSGPGYPDPLKEVVDLYLSHTAPRIDEIEITIAANDAAALAMIAHTLKSSSASVGAAAIASVAGQLEAIGARGTVGGAEQQLQLLKEQFPKVTQALLDACEQGKQ